MTEQQPTVGRIVHFHAGHEITDTIRQRTYPSNYPVDQPLAAIITEVNPNLDTLLAVKQSAHPEKPTGIVRLDVRYPGAEDLRPHYGPFYPYSETPKPGHWTWPPRA